MRPPKRTCLRNKCDLWTRRKSNMNALSILVVSHCWNVEKPSPWRCSRTYSFWCDASRQRTAKVICNVEDFSFSLYVSGWKLHAPRETETGGMVDIQILATFCLFTATAKAKISLGVFSWDLSIRGKSPSPQLLP